MFKPLLFFLLVVGSTGGGGVNVAFCFESGFSEAFRHFSCAVLFFNLQYFFVVAT